MSPPRDGDPPSSDDGSRADDYDRSIDDDGRPADEPAATGTDSTSGTDDAPGDPLGPDAEWNESRSAESDSGTVDGERSTDASRGTGSETARPGVPGTAPPDESDDGTDWLGFAVDIGSSAAAVLLVGLFLFAVSGVWPPMVAVESGSMYPHMQTGDLVFVMEEERFAGEGAHTDTGVVTYRAGEDSGFGKFGMAGDVVVYKPDGSDGGTPIIHRAMFWVEDGERWYDRADRQSVGAASSCEELENCPAPHAGFVTKGDANGRYDQAQGLSEPVRPSWIIGTAEVRIPKLGCIRLRSGTCDGIVPLSTDRSIGLTGATTSENRTDSVGRIVVGNGTAPASARVS